MNLKAGSWLLFWLVGGLLAPIRIHAAAETKAPDRCEICNEFFSDKIYVAGYNMAAQSIPEP